MDLTVAFQGNEPRGFQEQGQPWQFEFLLWRFQHEATRQHCLAQKALQEHEARFQKHRVQLHPNDLQAMQRQALAHQHAYLGRC